MFYFLLPSQNLFRFKYINGLRVNEWGDQALDVLNEFGKELNVDGLETNTAIAFERKRGKKRGFKKEFVTMTRDISYQDQKESKEAVDLF